MKKNKYDKYVISGIQPGDPPSSGMKVAWVNDAKFKGAHQYHVHWVFETPRNLKGMASWEKMGHGPHEHKQPEAVIHIGTNPDDPMDLGAEIWFYLGPELEKHVITKSCMVYLPAGFIHSPWVIKKVTRPFVIVTVMQETEHTELPHPELLSDEENETMMYISQGYTSKERIITTPKGVENEWN
ncbi:MAG: hypothetical protein JW762_12830 [Dehalococcoidales bacterium]|nr:hypothetical protein [Dehalococcoidales bacterium]